MLIDAHCHLTDCGDSAEFSDSKNCGDSADFFDSSDSENFVKNGDSANFKNCGNSSDSANCGDFANRGDSSDSANFAKNGDFADFKNCGDFSDSADFSDFSDSANFAKGNDSADFKNCGDSADSSDSANFANFAKNGDSADFKNCGDSADSSDSANFAKGSDSADFKNCGDSSDSADSSDSENFVKNDDSVFLKRIKKILLESEKAGVSALITSASRPADFPKILKLIESEENVFATIGVHPFYAEEFNEIGNFAKLLNHPKILGIGEIGLDFSPKYKPTTELQIAVLERQLALAHDFQKPIVLHCVGKNASATLLQTLKKFKNGNGRKIAHGENSDALQFRKSGIAHGDIFGESGIWRGVLHGFGGSVEEAKIFIKLGFKISFNGNLLKPNFKRVRQLAETLPTDSILIESDYPYTTHPANLPQILNTLAHLRQTPPETLHPQLHHNTRTAFNYYFPR